MMESKLQKELKTLLGEAVQFDVPLSLYTSIRIGGPASALVTANNLESLKKVVVFCRQQSLPYYMLGKGSNTLVLDGGFRGVVVHLADGFRQFGIQTTTGDVVIVRADGGVPTQQLVRWATMEGLTGLERLAGVPGTVGGNIMMNAGTNLGEIGELVESVAILNNQGNEKTLERSSLKFQYRSSNLPLTAVVVSTLLRLQKGEREKIEAKVREVFEKRSLAQPVEIPNLGSIFKNPKGKKAWELIEEAGLKGVRVGKARISEKHANFIVNEGGATAKDVLILIELVKEKVKKMFDIVLEREIRVIGEKL